MHGGGHERVRYSLLATARARPPVTGSGGELPRGALDPPTLRRELSAFAGGNTAGPTS